MSVQLLPVLPGAALSVGCGSSQKQQSELSDLDFIAVGQRRGLYGLTVDVGAVEAADVDNVESAVVEPKLGVPAADSDVVEEDVASGMGAAEVTGSSRRNRDPAFGPRLTTSNADPVGISSSPDSVPSATCIAAGTDLPSVG